MCKSLILSVVVCLSSLSAVAQTTAAKTLQGLQSFVTFYNENDKLKTEYNDLTLVSNSQLSEATKIVTEITPEGVRYKLHYNKEFLNKPELFARDLVILNGVRSNLKNKYHTFHEAHYNAEHGSIPAKLVVALYQIDALQGHQNFTQPLIYLGADTNPELKEKILLELKESLDRLVAERTPLLEKATLDMKARYKALEKWRQETQILDRYEAQTEKLNDLLLKNDRRGVRKMIEAYLPWQVMDAYETNIWKTWLDAIENPDLKNTTIAFRGVDYKTDKIQRQVVPGHGEKFAFMSTVLTKNQGSYTRRLRSITTMREKNGKIVPKIPAIFFSTMMSSHAGDPLGSSFLSFTYSLTVASGFIGNNKSPGVPGGGLLTVKMDKRRLLPNLVSSFSYEVELLAPLVVFPDEVVKYQEGRFNLPNSTKLDDYLKEVQELTGFDPAKDVKENAQKFHKLGWEIFGQANQRSESLVCSGIFR